MPPDRPLPSGVSPGLAQAYDEQYAEAPSEWRELGARYKCRNILEVAKGLPFRRVLDCGAGEGSVLQALERDSPWGEFYAVEISDSGLARIAARGLARLRELRKFDGTAIPYPERFFDLAVCSHVLEHVEHPRLLLRELRRVAAYQVFEVPLDYRRDVDLRVPEFLACGHINIFTPALFKFLLKSEGFEILAEKRSRPAPEVVRYNWYRNMKLAPTLGRELRLRLDPFLHALSLLRRGAAWRDEYGYAAYTCLARGVGGLRVL